MKKQEKIQVLLSWIHTNYSTFQDRAKMCRIVCGSSEDELDFMLSAI